jgi:hypothetical protein
MPKFIFKFMIVAIIFVCGVFAGGLLNTHKRAEEIGIVAVPVPQTALTLGSPDLDLALKSLNTMSDALADSAYNPEKLFNLRNSVKTALLQSSYQAAKRNYEMQLLKMRGKDAGASAFAEARDSYKSISELVQTEFPLKTEEQISLITS